MALIVARIFKIEMAKIDCEDFIDRGAGIIQAVDAVAEEYGLYPSEKEELFAFLDEKYT